MAATRKGDVGERDVVKIRGTDSGMDRRMTADKGTAPRRRVTLEDVARQAGCSTAAVSLWVNGKSDGRLTPANAARIEAAVKELGYVPNRIAQRLALGASRSVAYLFPGAKYGVFFGSIVDGVAERLGPSWDVSFYDAKHDPAHPDLSPLDRALASNPRALLISAPTEDVLTRAAALPVPGVVIDAPFAPDNLSLVSFAMRPAVAQMARTLRDLGHRRAAYVAFRGESLSLATRRDLVQGELDAAGISTVDDDLDLSSLDIEPTASAFAEIWPRWKASGVTAVVCADDRHTWGVIAASRRLQLSIPEDFSLVGFNDSEPGALLTPGVSAIRLSPHDIGEAAAAALEHLVAGGAPQRAEVQTTFERRGSVGHAPA